MKVRNGIDLNEFTKYGYKWGEEIGYNHKMLFHQTYNRIILTSIDEFRRLHTSMLEVFSEESMIEESSKLLPKIHSDSVQLSNLFKKLVDDGLLVSEVDEDDSEPIDE